MCGLAYNIHFVACAFSCSAALLDARAPRSFSSSILDAIDASTVPILRREAAQDQNTAAVDNSLVHTYIETSGHAHQFRPPPQSLASLDYVPSTAKPSSPSPSPQEPLVPAPTAAPPVPGQPGIVDWTEPGPEPWYRTKHKVAVICIFAAIILVTVLALLFPWFYKRYGPQRSRDGKEDQSEVEGNDSSAPSRKKYREKRKGKDGGDADEGDMDEEGQEQSLLGVEKEKQSYRAQRSKKKRAGSEANEVEEEETLPEEREDKPEKQSYRAQRGKKKQSEQNVDEQEVGVVGDEDVAPEEIKERVPYRTKKERSATVQGTDEQEAEVEEEEVLPEERKEKQSYRAQRSKKDRSGAVQEPAAGAVEYEEQDEMKEEVAGPKQSYRSQRVPKERSAAASSADTEIDPSGGTFEEEADERERSLYKSGRAGRSQGSRPDGSGAAEMSDPDRSAQVPEARERTAYKSGRGGRPRQDGPQQDTPQQEPIDAEPDDLRSDGMQVASGQGRSYRSERTDAGRSRQQASSSRAEYEGSEVREDSPTVEEDLGAGGTASATRDDYKSGRAARSRSPMAPSDFQETGDVGTGALRERDPEDDLGVVSASGPGMSYKEARATRARAPKTQPQSSAPSGSSNLAVPSGSGDGTLVPSDSEAQQSKEKRKAGGYKAARKAQGRDETG